MGEGRNPWADKRRLERRLPVVVDAQAELRAVVGELGACPYRSGLLGAGAPVLPSPDELAYAADILARLATCVRHALLLARLDEMADG